MKMIFALTLLALFFHIYSFEANAQSELSLAVSPPITEINVQGPANPQVKIQVQNLSETKNILEISLRSFTSSMSRDGQIELLGEEETPGRDLILFQNVRIVESGKDVEVLELNPFESRELTLDINVDEDTAPGDYYFSVLFISKQDNQPEVSSTIASGGIGTNIILSIGREDQAKGEVLSFSAPILSTTGPVPLTLVIKNNSEHYIKPTGTVIIKNLLGQEVGTASILPQYILAKSERYLIDSNQTALSDELTSFLDKHTELSPSIIWQEKFLLGMYTAEAHVKLAENGPSFVTKTTFFALPLRLFLTISFFIFILLGIYIKVKRRI